MKKLIVFSLLSAFGFSQNNQKIETERLTVPHPRALERNFVLHPLVEILDDFIFPGTSYNIKDCKKNCTDNSSIKKSNKTISLE